MIAKKPHPHADFLVEAVQNTNRKIEGKHIKGDFWEEITLSFVVASNLLWEFRFADTVKQKSRIMSSLTDHELGVIVAKHNIYGEDINYSILKAVANAAAEKHDADISKNKSGNARGNNFSWPKIMDEYVMTTPEEIISFYENTKYRMF